MRLEPLTDKVIIKRSEAQQTTPSGIVLPDVAQKKPTQGRVLSIGSGRRLDNGTVVPLQVQEGDRVIFSAWGATEVQIGDDCLLIVPEHDILAILE